MSTKLHNGYVIWGIGNDLSKLQQMLLGFADQASAAARQIFARLLAKYAVEMIDAHTLGQPNPWAKKDDRDLRMPLCAADLHLQARFKQVRATQRRDPEIDIGCSVCILPAGADILALLYTEQQELKSLWQSQPRVREFGYWDNTDRPASVSATAWRAREEMWKYAIGPSFVPARRGLSFDAVDSFMLPHVEKESVAEHIPALKKRADRWATSIERDAQMKAATAPDVMERFWATERWLKSDEGKAAVAERAKSVREKLRPVLTAADLVTNLPVQAAPGGDA